MPELPFQVAPKRRTEMISVTIDDDTYSLEFPVYRSLRAGEEIQIRDADYQAAVYRECSRFADALVNEGIEELYAQRLAIRCLSTRLGIPILLTAEEHRALLRHAAMVADIQSVLAAEYARQVRRTVTALIAHRLPGCKGWTEDDTDRAVPGPLRDAIAAFADRERNANQPQRTPEEMIESMAETLGKLGPEPCRNPPTGQLSTGAAESSGQLLLSSDPIDSHPSPSTTSSLPLKPAPAES